MLMIKQGKRLRNPNNMLATYAASQIKPDNVKSEWQKALDMEHKRHQIPDIYKDYKETPIASQMGLAQTAMRNYKSSRNRLRDITPVGV
jgi:hypothetical protein